MKKQMIELTKMEMLRIQAYIALKTPMGKMDTTDTSIYLKMIDGIHKVKKKSNPKA